MNPQKKKPIRSKPGLSSGSDMVTEARKEPVYQGQKRKGRHSGSYTIGEVRINGNQFHAIIEHHHAVMLLIDPDSGVIVDVNRAASRFYGYSMPELCAMNIADVIKLSPEEIAAKLKHAKEEGLNYLISHHKLANAEVRTVEIHSSPITIEDRTLLFSIVHDITKHKQCEVELETNVASLEELNTALRVILQQIEESREELHAAIVSNIGELVLPSLDKLKKSPLSSYQLSILQSIESNLGDISSSFLQKLKMIHYKFTSREIEIATLVKEGRSTKEISERMNITTKTVEFHRNRLREKLGLTKKKINLRSHLLTIK
jgi:PAS domain S-box-containing protein